MRTETTNSDHPVRSRGSISWGGSVALLVLAILVSAVTIGAAALLIRHFIAAPLEYVSSIAEGEGLATEPEVLWLVDRSSTGLSSIWREVLAGSHSGERGLRLLNDLCSDPGGNLESPFPPGTRARAFVLQGNTAFADFSEELLEGLGQGILRERVMLSSLCRTLSANMPETNYVVVLVEGRPIGASVGHLDWSVPVDVRRFLASATSS